MQIRDSVVELKSTKIWKYLEDIDFSYANTAVSFVKFLTPILSSIKDIFPFYTRHDAHHSFRVLLRIEQIVYKNCFDKSSALAFSADEILLLICAAYGHDLGMAVFPGEEETILNDLGIPANKEWRKNNELHSYLRTNHSKRGGAYISANANEIGFPISIASLLDKLMESHNLSINELDTQIGGRYAAGEKEIDLKQLACIFCIADSIEFSETRVVEGVLDILTKKIADPGDADAMLSYRHNMQSICISAGVAVGEDGKIIFTGTFTDPDTMSLAHNTIDLIENWLRSYNDIDFQSKIKRLNIRSDSIIRELSITGSDFERIGIRIKKENIIDLIASNSTWTTDSAIVLRELLQNSVEACRYRQFNSSEADNYRPKIDAYLNIEDRTLVISDNGCGMSRNIILNNFLTVGNSRSFEPSYSNVKYSSLARFGIGFWSVFTVANKASIETGPFEYLRTKNVGQETVDGVSFEVSIKEFKDYTVFKPINMSAGTKITLYLKNDFNMEDVLYRINYHIGCSEIPIEIHFGKAHTSIIPKKIKLPTISEAFGAKIGIVDQYDIKEFHCENHSDEIDTQIKIFYCEDVLGPTFVIPGSEQTILTYQNRSTLTMYRGSGICGFLFNYHISNTIVDFFRIGFFSANARNPKGYQFTLNRMGILRSPSYEIYESTIAGHVHACIRKLLSETGSNNPMAISRLSQQSRMNGGEIHGEFTHGSLSRFAREIPDLIAFKLYKVTKNMTLNSCDISYFYYEDLIKADLNLWLYSTSIYQIGFRVSLQTTSFIYELIKTKYEIGDNTYLLEPTREADMIADSSVNCLVYADQFINSNFTRIPIRNFRSLETDASKYKDFIIADVRGIWTGTIIERKIVGANFAILGQHHLVVNAGSLLANDIKLLYTQKLNFRICEIAYYLDESNRGFVHDSITEYL